MFSCFSSIDSVFLRDNLFHSYTGEDGCVKVKAVMYNVNYGHNRKLLESCRVLNEYSRFVHEIRQNEGKGLPLAEAVDEACRECIEKDILRSFLEKNRSEVMEVLLTTFDLDGHIKSEKSSSKP